MSHLVELEEALALTDQNYIVAHNAYMRAVAGYNKSMKDSKSAQQKLMEAIDSGTENAEMLIELRQLRKNEADALNLVGTKGVERSAIHRDLDNKREQIRKLKEEILEKFRTSKLREVGA